MLDPHWFDLLMDETVFGEEMTYGDMKKPYIPTEKWLTRDEVLFSCIPLKFFEKMAPYFHKRALQVKDNADLCSILLHCGCEYLSGLVLEYVRKNVDMGLSFAFISDHFTWIHRIYCWSGWVREIREIDRFLCGFPKDSPQRKNWDPSDRERFSINYATRLLDLRGD